MTRILFFVPLLLLFAGCANQQVQNAFQGDKKNTALVTSSGTVLIKYIDNDEVNEGFIGQEIDYRVDAGKRTLLLEYSDLFNVSSDDHEKVVSRPAKVTFNAEAGKAYKVVNPKQSDLQSAKDFAEQPTFSVLDVKTGAVIQSSIELSRPRTFLTQLKSAVTPVYEFESDQIQTAPPAVDSSALDMLKSAWSKASEEERAAFKTWLSQQ